MRSRPQPPWCSCRSRACIGCHGNCSAAVVIAQPADRVPRSSVFLGSVRGRSEAGHLAASLMPRVRQRSMGGPIAVPEGAFPDAVDVSAALVEKGPGRQSLLQQDNGQSGRFGLRYGQWKLVRQPASTRGSATDSPSKPTDALYELDADPGETTDVARRPSRCDRPARGCDRPDHERAAAGVIGLPGHAWTGGTLNMNWFCGDSFRCPRPLRPLPAHARGWTRGGQEMA